MSILTIDLPRRPSLAVMSEAARAVVAWLMHSSSGGRAAEAARRLSALSDGALARRGLRRDAIVRHAFAGLFYR